MQKAKFVLSKSKVLEQYGKVKDSCDVVSYASAAYPEKICVRAYFVDERFDFGQVFVSHVHTKKYVERLILRLSVDRKIGV